MRYVKSYNMQWNRRFEEAITLADCDFAIYSFNPVVSEVSGTEFGFCQESQYIIPETGASTNLACKYKCDPEE